MTPRCNTPEDHTVRSAQHVRKAGIRAHKNDNKLNLTVKHVKHVAHELMLILRHQLCMRRTTDGDFT